MADNANKEIKTATADDGSTGYEMKIGLGTIAMLISATGMGLVPLFSRWATRTDMFDGAMGLNAGDSIGALMAVGRMSMGVLFFVVIMFATGKVETFKKLKLTPAIALGGLMIGMSLACYVTSTLLTTISNAVLFIYIGPVVCVVLARIFRKEPMSALQWVCLVAVFIGMLFGNNLMGFNESGFFVDFNLVPSTPEFPQKGLGDAFGLASGFFYGASMFFNGYRKDADTTARGVWNFIFAVLRCRCHHRCCWTCPGCKPRHGELGSQHSLHRIQLDRRPASLGHLRSSGSGLPVGGWPATCRLLTTAPSRTGKFLWPSSWAWLCSAA